ncbi:kinetochore protein NDC80 homolog [Stegodyphus dumicola]|uniref:kinetochore protein NDC80 homolog n=1 Tax=Stegodyphus dumicola TaxID=202533 RepID=UPI0015A84E2A|nr:kinetochore protein NDC80 homolog [Stegodyphus dumicola]
MRRSSSKADSSHRSSSQSAIPKFRNRSSSVDLGNRVSYGSRLKIRSSSEERRSGNGLYARWSGARKSSINLNEGKRILKDPRPLSDKNYQKQKVKELMEFLEQVGYSHSLTISSMMPPTKKEFENIFQFLYGFWCSSYKVQKIEEEAPKILKNLSYPFVLNKSSFAYVARNNWPSLLGVLLWLMDLNKFVMNIDPNILFASGDSERPQEHAVLLNFICQSHYNGTDNEDEEKDLFLKIIKARMPEDATKVEEENLKKKIQIEELQKNWNAIQNLKKDIDLLDQEIKKYEIYNAEMLNHKPRKVEACERLNEELKTQQSELETLKAEVNEKEKVYEVQGYDGRMQLNYFESQKKELVEKLQNKNKILKELQNKCWELEMQHTQGFDKTSELCEKFNNLYDQNLQMVKTALAPLKNVKHPQAKALYETAGFQLPNCKMLPGQYHSSQKLQMKTLLEAKEKLANFNMICKTLSSNISQRLNEILMIKSGLSASLKVASTEENQTVREYSNEQKQALEEIAVLQAQLDELVKMSEQLQLEKMETEKLCRDSEKEFIDLKALKAKKKKELENYLQTQSRLISKYRKDEKNILKLKEDSGKEIAERVEAFVKNIGK